MAEPLNATFFTLKSRPRAVLLPATLATMALVGLIVAAFAALNWGTLSSIPQLILSAPEGGDEEIAMRLMGGIFMLVGSALLLLFPLYLALAAYEAACLRWMIRGEAPGLFGLALDADTWRVYGVYWCWFLAHLTLSFGFGILMIPIMLMSFGSIAMDPSADPAALAQYQLTIQLPFTLLQYLVLIFLGVRFSPAAATSVARRRFSFFEAWTVTRGRFWALLGAWVLLWLIFLAVYSIVGAFTFGAVFAQLWPLMLENFNKPGGDHGAEVAAILLAPGMWTTIGLGYLALILVGLGYALMSFGVNARAALLALEEGKIEQATAD